MAENWLPTSIEGVYRRTTVAHDDSRGSFMELWRASLTAPLGEPPMVQANLSRSNAGALRGMHFHLRQVDLWLVVDGRAVAAITDVRPAIEGASPVTEMVELAPGDALYIPRGVAHGFLALNDVALMYLVSNEYDGTDELGFAWDDPDAAIPWPQQPLLLSDRDRSNPSLKELLATLPQP
jgi:dTDP-4-dehydrorhamnose 3,5-epimerase